MASSRKNKSKENVISKIRGLFEMAKEHPEKADRYVKISREIGMKINQPIPKDLKKKFCKHCNSYFQQGNYRVRTRNKLLIYTCLRCNKQTRYGIKT